MALVVVTGAWRLSGAGARSETPHPTSTRASAAQQIGRTRYESALERRLAMTGTRPSRGEHLLGLSLCLVVAIGVG